MSARDEFPILADPPRTFKWTWDSMADEIDRLRAENAAFREQFMDADEVAARFATQCDATHDVSADPCILPAGHTGEHRTEAQR